MDAKHELKKGDLTLWFNVTLTVYRILLKNLSNTTDGKIVSIQTIYLIVFSVLKITDTSFIYT